MNVRVPDLIVHPGDAAAAASAYTRFVLVARNALTDVSEPSPYEGQRLHQRQLQRQQHERTIEEKLLGALKLRFKRIGTLGQSRRRRRRRQHEVQRRRRQPLGQATTGAERVRQQEQDRAGSHRH